MTSPTEIPTSQSNGAAPVPIAEVNTTSIPNTNDQYELNDEQLMSRSFVKEDAALVTPMGSLKPTHGTGFIKRAEIATESPIPEDDVQAEATIEDVNGAPETDLEKALRLRDKLDALLRRTMKTKQQCDRLEQDNKYLQEFVGNLMNSGEYLTRKV